MTTPLEDDLERQLAMTHERLVIAMGQRVPAMSLEQKERYFAMLSLLVSKLERADKPLREILQEMMAEAAPHILREMSGS